MGQVANWVLGGAAGIMSLGGLFVASRAGQGVGYWGGLAMFAFCVLFIFYLVKTGFDREEHAEH